MSPAAIIMTSLTAGQSVKPTRGLPIVAAEACRIQFTPGGEQGKWGGRIAIYDLASDNTGTVIGLERRIIEGREHLQKRVRLQQFELCIRRWRFDGRGHFKVALLGGSILDGTWIIEAMKDGQTFRLRSPVTPGDR